MTSDGEASPQTDSEDRPRGIFTPEDRAWLRGESDLTKGSEYNKRRHIRERYKNSIKDISVLAKHWDDLPQREREKFAEVDTEEAIAHLVALSSGHAALETVLKDKLDDLETAIEVLES